VNFFATAARGTEGALRDELREIRLRRVRADRGGVHFEGEMDDGYRACLRSRIAMRILRPVAAFPAATGDDLYEGVATIDWSEFLTRDHTLAVRATCVNSAMTHSLFIAQKTKDAIVDQLREKSGARPSVDLESPDVTVSVHVTKDQATVYVDLAGVPLHRRGYRSAAGEAPLKETLAAAMVRLSGWDRVSPFIDPMCGSGTIAIEAAALAANIAPGLLRERFGFERWASFQGAGRMRELREEARAARVPLEGPIFAGDIDPAMVAMTLANARSAGVDVEVHERDVRDLRPLPAGGAIVTNPPYGERLEAEATFLREMGRTLMRLEGHDVAVIAGSPEIAQALGKPDRWLIVYNGAIECRLLFYRVARRASGR
jgi:putative N6-adenine-specific DNA methylase